MNSFNNLFKSENRGYIFVSSLLILSFIINVSLSIYSFCIADLNHWSYSELLINFQGGFVRRGLFGELLFQSYSLHPYNLKLYIFIACYIFFFGVFAFFLRQFNKHKYCWWLIFSPLFLNLTTFIIRKDYILYAILIGILYTVRSNSPKILSNVSACLLVILALLFHEAFLFWGFPIYALLILSEKRYSWMNYIWVSLPLCIAFITCIYKGSTDTTYAIVNSWNAILPDAPMIHTSNNSIGAIGWASIHTFLFHLKRNIGLGGAGIILTPFIALIAYYLFTNFLFVFRKKGKHNKLNKLELSLLYSSMMVCLVPMLTVLSCDTGRVFQYATVTTFSTFLIIPRERILSAYPRWFKIMIMRLNHWLDIFFPPNKVIMTILLLFLSVSPVAFDLPRLWETSVIGKILFTFMTAGHKIIKLFFL